MENENFDEYDKDEFTDDNRYDSSNNDEGTLFDNNDTFEWTEELLNKYGEIENKISKEEFEKKFMEIRKQSVDNPYLSEESIADQVIGLYETRENEYLTDEPEHATDSIEMLEKGDKDKFITGRVMSISTPRKFTTSKGKAGKVCNLELADNTGQIRVVLWTENIKHLKNINEGDIVQIGEVDINEGYQGGLEAVMRPRSRINEIEDADMSKYPSYSEEITNISDLKADTKANIIARIAKIPTVRTYNKDGKDGKVASLELQDATGSISYTLWNNSVELIDSLELHDNDTIKILNAQVRSRDGELSLSHWDGRIIKGNYDVPEINQEISKIGDLDDDDKHVSIIGVVSKVQDVITFTRKSDNSKGYLRNFDLKDDTGSMRITLWGEDTKLNINKGDIVKIIDCDVREDDYTDNGYSINTGFSTQITINPDNLSTEEYDDFNNIKEELSGTMSIEEVKLIDDDGNGRDVDVIGRIMSVSDVRTFERQDGTEGRVRSSVLSDGTDVIDMTLWDDKVETDIETGGAYTIENARTRWGYEDVELNIGRASRIIKLAESDDRAKFLPSFETLEKMLYEYRDISDLDEDDRNIYIVGRVFEVYDIRQFERDDGSKNTLRNIEMADKTGSIRVSLWGEDSKREFEAGEPIKIQNPGFSFYNDELTINISGNSAIVKPSDDELMNLPSYDDLKEAIYVEKTIESIEENDVNVRVTGTLSDLRSDKLAIIRCPNCNSELYDDTDICENCGADTSNPKTTLMIPARLNDDTGNISLTFFDNLVEELLELPKEEIINKELVEPGVFDGVIEDLEGITVEVIANVSFDDYNEENRLNPRKILQKYY